MDNSTIFFEILGFNCDHPNVKKYLTNKVINDHPKKYWVHMYIVGILIHIMIESEHNLNYIYSYDAFGFGDQLNSKISETYPPISLQNLATNMDKASFCKNITDLIQNH